MSILAPVCWGQNLELIFDNTKIKMLVPNYQAAILFHEGICKVLTWFDEDEQRKHVNKLAHDKINSMLRAYQSCQAVDDLCQIRQWIAQSGI